MVALAPARRRPRSTMPDLPAVEEIESVGVDCRDIDELSAAASEHGDWLVDKCVDTAEAALPPIPDVTGGAEWARTALAVVPKSPDIAPPRPTAGGGLPYPCSAGAACHLLWSQPGTASPGRGPPVCDSRQPFPLIPRPVLADEIQCNSAENRHLPRHGLRSFERATAPMSIGQCRNGRDHHDTSVPPARLLAEARTRDRKWRERTLDGEVRADDGHDIGDPGECARFSRATTMIS